ncbi:Di-/tripeptide transporter [Corynebacterium felinum]|uniref:POT family proton-dependent oligopeptide transporter n=3 Tax=Corynebacterium felinum TaxID=131318 RepID=A0ABU2BAC4_9CORY|nr:POT family proton-dependent oligopeptide transporter [Corynebacterium felinum]WJY94905.1 Di-/tripeptide transporter [Corynebacterium felinum]
MTKLEQRTAVADRPHTPPTPSTPRNLMTTVHAEHPLATFNLVSIEAWERFSFYGMQAILAFYLYYSVSEGGIGIDKSHATALIGAYGALVYLCTFAGGWVADRILGPERTLLIGAGLLVAGHLILSLAPHPVIGLALGLSLIAVGSGSLKTAAITILGAVYREDSHNARETGFQFFYLGIQIVAILGPLITGWLAQAYSFHHGFLAAAALMIIGMISYISLRRRMIDALDPDIRTTITQPANPINTTYAIFIFSCGTVIFSGVVTMAATGTIQPADLAFSLLIVTCLAALILLVVIIRSPKTTTVERRKVIAFLPLFFASACFWAIMNQTYGVLAVYSDIRLNRMLFGFEIPAAWTQSLNPFFVITFALLLTFLWAKLGSKNPQPTTKLSLGVMIASLSFFVFIPFAGGANNTTPFIIFAFAVWIAAIGELLCGPVGMAATAEHAPQAYRTQFSALFFLTMAIGTSLAGTISRFYDPENPQAEITYFLTCGISALIIGLITLIFGRILHQRLT